MFICERAMHHENSARCSSIPFALPTVLSAVLPRPHLCLLWNSSSFWSGLEAVPRFADVLHCSLGRWTPTGCEEVLQCAFSSQKPPSGFWHKTKLRKPTAPRLRGSCRDCGWLHRTDLDNATQAAISSLLPSIAGARTYDLKELCC